MQFVPMLLTMWQKQLHLKIACNILDKMNSEPNFLNTMVSTDEFVFMSTNQKIKISPQNLSIRLNGGNAVNVSIIKKWNCRQRELKTTLWSVQCSFVHCRLLTVACVIVNYIVCVEFKCLLLSFYYINSDTLGECNSHLIRTKNLGIDGS